MYKTGRQKKQGPLNGHHEITFSDENNMDYFSKPKTVLARNKQHKIRAEGTSVCNLGFVSTQPSFELSKKQ